MLNIDQNRESGFRRLLQSGGSKVAARFYWLLQFYKSDSQQIFISFNAKAVLTASSRATFSQFNSRVTFTCFSTSLSIYAIFSSQYLHIFCHHNVSLTCNFSPGPAKSVPVHVQRGYSSVCRLQSPETWRLQSRRIRGHLPRSHMLEARVHCRLPHAG